MREGSGMSMIAIDAEVHGPRGRGARVPAGPALTYEGPVWRPTKTTTRKLRYFCALHHHDRMLMSSCHIAFEHRHVILHFVCLKLFSKNIFCFLNTSSFIQTTKPGSPEYFVLCTHGLQKPRF